MSELTTGQFLDHMGLRFEDFEKDMDKFPAPSARDALNNFLSRKITEGAVKEAALMKKQGFTDKFGGQS